MRLPQKFVERMQQLLGEEWAEMSATYTQPFSQGLRVNTLKISPENFLKRVHLGLEPVLWTEDGFYYPAEQRPAKNPYYQAGLYYLQEPSAMAPALYLGVQPGDKVLDMCAAPGGKSTYLATLLKGQGLLVSNDNSEERVKALVWNMEHWGASNVVITNEEPERLAQVLPGYFDKILIDAPCSGEGMFRKEPKAIRSWESYDYNVCSSLQKKILHWGSLLLKPGGNLLYSTCTFSPEENEGSISTFLAEHDDFNLVALPLDYGWETGRPDWCEYSSDDLRKTRRLWPHKIKGEGHFLALLQKRGQQKEESYNLKHTDKVTELEPMYEFMEENINKLFPGPFVVRGHYVYQVSPEFPQSPMLKVVRPGLFLGILKKNRFEPSQALAMTLKPSEVKRSISFSRKEPFVEKYLKGETLLVEGEKGWTLVCLDEFPLGWAKQTGEHLKNYYPPGWRIVD